MDNIIDAAREIAARLKAAYLDSGRIHAETVIGAAAAIAGEWSLWATGLPVPESGWIVMPAAAALLLEGGGSARQLIAAAVANAGGDAQRLPPAQVLVARAAAAQGGAYPPLTVDQSHYPNEWSPLAGPRFRADVKQICAAQGLDDSKQVFVATVMTVSLLISATASVLDPTVAGTLALEVMVGVSRMSPAENERSLTQQATP
jgi:hypothetical protein